MPLSWNEIKSRAAAFTKEWENTEREEAEAKSFLDAFFNVFDISRRKVGTFEHKVRRLNDKDGYIDLIWKGVILVEMKSRGKDLDKAFAQAKDYAQTLPQHELPKYILVCDFNTFKLYDTEEQKTHEFLLKDFVQHVNLFGFISGYQKKTYKEQDPANIDAAMRMGKLHDRLEEIGYTGHVLEIYLVRMLFCLFAEDTTIFEKQQFQDYIEQRTAIDGSDLAAKLQELFQVLNTPTDKRFRNLDEQLAAFPYVNGKLFEEPLPTASFDSGMRQALLNCCYMDWSKISPAIFGSMFQSVMNPKERRNLGAHYTSEKNILKLIKPLFLDELWEEFEKVKSNANGLKKFHDKISKLRFLDPACGCGNFLIIAYRELRLLEIEILKLQLKGQTVTDIGSYILLDVDKFYGIEYEEFPAQIAQVAMWLIDHQMNMQAGLVFGDYYARLPLRKSATIVHGNALRIDWQSLLQPQLSDVWNKENTDSLHYDYIIGNPPFVGSKLLSESQRLDMTSVGRALPSLGLLDYVTAWYLLCYQYINISTNTKSAFVSTNSITQGEQVSILWPHILKNDVEIAFAYRSFVWSNEARGNAKVHCVIIGLAKQPSVRKIYDVDSSGSIIFSNANNINPYLFDYKNIFLPNRSKSICNVPNLTTGNKPIDNGYYIFDENQKEQFVKEEPNSEKLFKKFIGALEFINGGFRWILDLRKVQPNDLRQMPNVLERVNLVKIYREQSDSLPTKKLALRPTRYHTEFDCESTYLILPEVSSERRNYMPIGFGDQFFVPSNKLRLMPDAKEFEFGILISKMHNVWIKTVSGRMKSDISYSVTLTYNNFPWPENPSDKQKEAVEKAAQAVLDARAQFPNSSLADLYDPNTMPPALVKAHQQLDKAVDLCYRPQPFINETKRIEFLFELYDKYTAGLFVKEKKKKKLPSN